MHPIRTHADGTARTRANTGMRLALIALVGLLPTGAFAQNAPADPPAQQPGQVPMDWGDAAAPARPARPAPQPRPAEPEEPTINFGIFSEPVQLNTLIDLVGQTLGINIVVKGSPTGEIVFNAPVAVPRSKLLDLLDAMLEQYGFTIVSEPTTGFYIVQPVSDVRPSVGGSRASVRIIPTPNIKPSQLVGTLTSVLGTGGATGGTTGTGVQAVDELGVVIVTAPARDIARVEALVEELRRVDAQQRYIRIDLDYIAAPAARDRAIALVGGSSSTNATSGFPGMPQQQMQRGQQRPDQNQGLSGAGGSFSNLADRITVNPQGNALVFRGTEDEIARVRDLMTQIDVPPTLKPRTFYAGSSAQQIAQMAQNRGLGEVIEVENANSSMDYNQMFFQQQLRQQMGQQQTTGAVSGGPVMVVDAAKGNIIYYGTPQQHEQMDTLMRELRTDDERVVIRSYVLNHSDAETVADLITGLITGQRQTGDAPLLPTSRGMTGTNRTGMQARLFNPADQSGSGDEVSASFDPDIVVVLPNIENNQVVVQAPLRQQAEIEKLIDRLDRRRAQVYIQAMIVSIADDEDFTLAFESQYLRGEFGIGTNFGLSEIGNSTEFTDPRVVNPGLAGLTSAIIRSDYVPLIINASQTNSNVRIVSSPQLLVNDNEESEIVSIEQQPYSTTTIGQTTDQTNFGGYEDAGTTLRVTPSISDGGFLRLNYYVELSNFTRTTGIGNNPPPRNTRTVTGRATIPSDATIVVGGLTVEDVRNTVAKVPFIGDIPLLGELFKRTDKINNRAKLYVFLTPRIMTDPNFNDLRLLTQGPQAEMSVSPDAPDLQPERIRSTPSNRSGVPDLQPANLD